VSSSVITGLGLFDVRFPTSLELHGSDALHVDPDYSAAYVVLRTSDGLEGHGFTFTCGRGNEVQIAAMKAMEPLVVGIPVDGLEHQLGHLWRLLASDSQLRWLGPEKGVVHMAAGAIINAAWDLVAKRTGKPLWKVLADLSPEQLVDLVDFRYLTDALSRDEALDLLRAAAPGRAERENALLTSGYPAYTTTPGWLGYSDDTMSRLAREAIADGFTQIKLKVGASLEQDLRRCGIAREVVGPDIRLAIDANQAWDVSAAVEWTKALAQFDIWWVEEPTSPDDILGHAAIRSAVSPVKVATGEHVHNRVMFKQFLQAGALDIVQIDACRVGGVNENIAILLLAAKYGVPVCPHAGGVGLCEIVQHLAMFDFIAVSGSLEDRTIEFADHLHEHFVTPAQIRNGRYVVPTEPGSGAEMHAESIARFTYPDGPAWQG
jgi:L-fuconate dehydratase